MKRRDFLKASLAGVLGGVGLQGAVARAEGSRRLQRIGVQLYTVRSLLQQDFPGTLKAVAAAGYKELEFAGYYNRSAADVKSIIQDLSLEAPATHVSLQLARNQLDQIIQEAGVIGHRYLVVPSLPQTERTTLDSYRRIAEEFNRLGERCRQAGLRFGYHNHAFEFETIEGKIPYDVLLQETDPNLVEMEIDLFWIVRGGQDPLEYFERFPGRFALCHVKDMDEAGNMVDVGKGRIDFAAIFARSEQAGLKHYFVEHDRPESPLESIQNSRRHLAQLAF